MGGSGVESDYRAAEEGLKYQPREQSVSDRQILANALERVAQAARDHGKWSGIITSNKGLLQRCKRLGMTCFSAGSELSALSSGARDELESVRAL